MQFPPKLYLIATIIIKKNKKTTIFPCSPHAKQVSTATLHLSTPIPPHTPPTAIQTHINTSTLSLFLLSSLYLSLSLKLKTPSSMADYQRSPQQQQQQRPTTEAIRGFLPEKGPSTQQIIAVVTLLPLGGFLLLLSGLTFFGSLNCLTVSAPLFLLFRPVLVPAAFVIFLAVAGILSSCSFGVTGLSSLTWLSNFFRGITASLPE